MDIGGLAERFESLDALARAEKDQLEEIPEIGPEIAESVQTFFKLKENQEVLKGLEETGVRVQEIKKSETGALPFFF